MSEWLLKVPEKINAASSDPRPLTLQLYPQPRIPNPHPPNPSTPDPRHLFLSPFQDAMSEWLAGVVDENDAAVTRSRPVRENGTDDEGGGGASSRQKHLKASKKRVRGLELRGVVV